MRKESLRVCAAALAIAAAVPAFAQGFPGGQASPAATLGGMADGTDGAFAGYVPSVRSGMMMGGQGTDQATPGAEVQPAGQELPAISDGRIMNPEKIEGFNEVIEQNFPMTPEMVRRYRDIYEENERALSERKEPEARSKAAFISLEPGETPSEISVAPGIASVIGFYDATGQAWPIQQYVLGSGADFQVVGLGDPSNNIAITPLKRFGWTNLIVVLQGQAKPVVMRIGVSDQIVDDRLDVQVMAQGPNATTNTAARNVTLHEAGSGVLLSALSGVDLPASAQTVRIDGVDARAWRIGESLFIRSKHALLSPSWLSSMSGPDGVRVYEISPGPVALFSVNGQIVRADVILP